MLPSLVVDEVRRGVAETLRAQFEPSTALFKDAVRRLIDEPTWVKGPYIQLGMPFVPGTAGKDFFKDFRTEHPAHLHQELAWQRCAVAGKSTLVATGTGSGKTECFLYPVLDHVARARQMPDQPRGIKAIIIYPMNALADDQAGRIAELVHGTPAFAGIRVGLFVGSGKTRYRPAKAGQNPEPDHPAMGPDHVITDKDVLRDNPPDILLTNYKMLDFLLIRPRDQPLWRFNAPETLRYLIVDELHTFDGAQGTDLAMLIRRLRQRLKCDDCRLICIGTSATLGDAGPGDAGQGDAGGTRPLRDYAGQIFATEFDADAVITERRQGFDAFIGDRVVESLLADDAGVLRAISARDFAGQPEAVATFLPAFFNDPGLLAVLMAGIETAEGRVRLGEELKKHLLFQTLLRIATQAPVSVHEIADRMTRTLSAGLRPHADGIIIALLTLVAWARAPYAGQSVTADTPTGQLSHLVTLRVQIWVQELRRVLATVSAKPEEIELASEASVLSRREQLRLPVVQCSNCRATGWLTLKAPQESRVEQSPDKIYAAFFARNRDPFLARIYPRADMAGGQRIAMTPVLAHTLCGQCGALGHDQVTQCPHCRGEDILPVFRVSATRAKRLKDKDGGQAGREVTVHDDICPVCGERDRLLIIGAQTTSIAAHAVERLWAAPLNHQKKLILFSDSVQDAAHRAGYIESKTEGHLMRAGLAKALATLPPTLPWDQALERLGRSYLDSASPLAMTPRDFVARFIPPAMEWLRDWKHLLLHHDLPQGASLPDLLCRRLQWRAVEELTYRSDRGRTLSKVGVAVLFPDLDALRTVNTRLLPVLREAGGGLEHLDEECLFHWVLGTLLALIRAGGVFHLDLEKLAETGDFGAFEFAPHRKRWMPHRGKSSPPRFVTREAGRHDFLNLEERAGNPLLTWAQLALGINLYSPGILTLAYEELLKALEQSGLGRFVQMDHRGEQARVFGLNADRLNLHQQLRRLVTPSAAQALWVPEEAADALDGLPAWNSPGERLRPDPVAAPDWWQSRFKGGDLTRVIAHEHTGLLERDERLALQTRFMAKPEETQPWFENLLSATPTLEMGIDIGALASVMLGGVPPNQANFIQRIGRAGRLDGNAAVFAIADASPDGHDQYYFANPLEMLHGAVEAPAIYLGAAEVLRRQLYAFFFDHWVAEGTPALPDKLSEALDQVASGDGDIRRFPFNYLDFVNRHEPILFDAFCRMLGSHLTPETREKLEGFISGSEQHKNLRARFLAFFEEAHAERESWKARRKKINQELGRLKKRPEDEQTLAEIALLETERAGLGQRIQQMNNEHLLEAMTNAGLLPNYAFPEEGVSLTTIVHGAKSATGEPYATPVHRYSRPAHAALAEFAPLNTFFAHKSKVQIDQVDMSVEPPLAHRFCPSCHVLSPLTDPAAHQDRCPHCGNTGWADTSQVRPLLRLRRAVANIDRADRTRITESDEARNPRYYARRLLMNFDAGDVRNAWRLESSQAIYGFEFIARAVFHDLNLGQPSVANPALPSTIIAGDDSTKSGFALCGECGKVQRAVRAGQDDTREQAHTPDCRHRHATGSEHLLSELFLYRQFESECLRILVPRGFGSGDRTTYSFMSALQLGLRKRFGGKVDHLRFETMAEPGSGPGSEPAADASSGKSYILIYDSVPGGTGYLQQMLAGEANTLTEVLAVAHAVIRDCGCRDKDGVDGCYQCVFQYRQGRHRKNISRSAALEMLDELVQGDFKRTQVPCLSEININPAFGSELERRFLPAIKALSGHLDSDNSRFPVVQVTQDIKAGKTAYLLTLGANTYWVDTQWPIEDPASGHVLCQPDFLITPTKTASPMRPIAVFVDGWEFHQMTLSEDARKRATLMLRGDYRVWSVTYEDIEAAHALKTGTDLPGPLDVLETDTGRAIPLDRLPPFSPKELASNAIALLLRLLGQADSTERDPLDQLRETGRYLLIKSTRRPHEIDALVKARHDAVLRALPDWLGTEARAVHLHSPGKMPLQWVGSAEPKFMTGKDDSAYPQAGALVLDDAAGSADFKFGRRHWRQWLRLANLLQAVPGVALLTQSLLDAGATLSVLAPSAVRPARVGADWNRILDENEFLDRLRTGFLSLANSGRPAPEQIGAEIEDDGGYRMAEALWEQARVVFLSAGQTDFSPAWQAAGFRVIEEGDDWWLAVEAALTGQGS
ncbi:MULTISPECIES: DEAD/DEAH box helicase [unclassified Thiocapsa]|uniref:DEAD/DEAH box helicase n=1 Tax=unclassified Thiocapsa TaxID=2641286 RepID=UPI0035B1B4D0